MPTDPAPVSAQLSLSTEITQAIQASGFVPIGKQTLDSVAAAIFSMIQVAIPIAQSTTLTGPEKKAAVVAAIMGVLSPLVAAIDIPWVPGPMEAVIDPYIDKVLESVLMSGIDSLVALYNRFALWAHPALPASFVPAAPTT